MSPSPRSTDPTTPANPMRIPIQWPDIPEPVLRHQVFDLLYGNGIPAICRSMHGVWATACGGTPRLGAAGSNGRGADQRDRCAQRSVPDESAPSANRPARPLATNSSSVSERSAKAKARQTHRVAGNAVCADWRGGTPTAAHRT